MQTLENSHWSKVKNLVETPRRSAASPLPFEEQVSALRDRVGTIVLISRERLTRRWS